MKGLFLTKIQIVTCLHEFLIIWIFEVSKMIFMRFEKIKPDVIVQHQARFLLKVLHIRLKHYTDNEITALNFNLVLIYGIKLISNYLIQIAPNGGLVQVSSSLRR